MLTQSCHTVLIVDDAEHDREAYRRYLIAGRDRTYRILEEDSAEGALALYEKQGASIDVILLDYRLPGKDGLEFLGALQARVGEHCPPVILMTGQGSEAAAVQAFKQGIADYLIKGEITPERLRQSIDCAIENGRHCSNLPIAEADRKSAELSLQLANERFELVMAAVDGLIYDYDLQSNSVVRSAGLTNLLGYSLAEAEPTADWWWNLIHPEDVAKLGLEEMHERMSTRSRISGEYRVRHKDGHYVWVEERSFVIQDESGQAIRMVGCTTNISDRKQFEQEREQLLAQAQAAKEEAERANQSKDDFLAMVSHELRSPLNAIQGWAGILRAKQLAPERVEQALATIERNARSQGQLIEDLLDVSRIIRGELRLMMAPVHLVQTLETTLQNVQLMAEAKQIVLCSRIDHTLDSILGDEHRLQQIITNLLTNAIKFTPQGGRVELELLQVDHMAQIVVRDNGKGIEAEFLPFVFERFWQAGRSKEGLGLGLAIAHHLVERHGGTITAESPGLGQGTTFTVQLPLQSMSLEVFYESTSWL